MYGYPHRGSYVEVVDGRYKRRWGTVVDIDVVHSGRLRLYPVVLLEPKGRAKTRRHRFVAGSLYVLTGDVA